jgi:hypothetical protein
VSVRWAAGRQEVVAGSWASLEASWAVRGSGGVAGLLKAGWVRGAASIGGGSCEQEGGCSGVVGSLEAGWVGERSHWLGRWLT